MRNDFHFDKDTGLSGWWFRPPHIDWRSGGSMAIKAKNTAMQRLGEKPVHSPAVGAGKCELAYIRQKQT